MLCPTCDNVNLAMADRQGIEIDYCPQCRGIWLDRGELDRLIERAEQASAPALPSAPPPYRDAHARDESILGMRTVEVAVTASGYGFSRRRFEGWQPLEGRDFASIEWQAGTRPRLPRSDARLAFRFDPTGATEPATLVLLREGRSARVSVDGDGKVAIDAPVR